MRFAYLRLRVCALLGLTLLLGSSTTWGQAGNSTIRGVVTDPQGAVVPSATVTITSLTIGFTRSQVTNLGGAFSFELVPPGAYKVEVEAKGFRKKVMSGVEALVGRPTDASTQLEIGDISEIVTVEASATVVQVNTQDATLGNNFMAQQLKQLPMEARNVQALLTLQPAVTREGYVAGARSDQSNITLDGVDINDAQTNSLDSPVLRLNYEALEEFRVTTVNANANQGRSSAAQINLVTKSGTNDFHGSLFEYHRNTIFTANDFFRNRSGLPRTKLIRNTFGGTAGGPILKDKLFFFYSYEGRRDAREGTALRVVPLAHLGRGEMRVLARTCADITVCPNQTITLTTDQLNNTIFPVVRLNPLAIQVLGDAAKKYPFNDTTVGDGLNTRGFRFNTSIPVNVNSHVARVDWRITSNQTLFARSTAIYDLEGGLPQFPDTPAPNLWSHPWGGVISHNWTFSKNWVNNFRYGYTKAAFSQQGDSSDDSISFRFVFSPRAFTRTLSRTTPVHNIINDTSWVKGSHTVQFGTNIRIVRNSRVSFATAFDSAITNPSFYVGGGASVASPIRSFLRSVLGASAVLASTSAANNAATALIGRYSQYTDNFIFDRDGSLLPSGKPSSRTFATEEYEGYVQDTWKFRRNLTLSYGLRYSISRPVYETRGFEVKPDIPLDEFLRRRIAGAAAGTPFLQPLTLNLSGPANGKSPLYRWDRNNFQPSVSAAWSPNFENRWLKMLFGDAGRTVIRSGFRITNDYYGQQLAVAFDLNNTLGFSSNFTIPANTYNVTTRPAPLFTGFDQKANTLPNIVQPGKLTFPRQQPADLRRRIESSLDEGLTAPINYQWNLTFERELPFELVFQASYIGRVARHLLATRDVMALNNLVDTKSRMDWYTAATTLEKIRQTGADPATVKPVAWFENILPANYAGLLNDFYPLFYGLTLPSNFTPTQAVYFQAFNIWGNDWTDTQDELEFALDNAGLFSGLFFNPQYGALSAWGTIANSYYHGLAISVRQRYRGLVWDFNYTFSHSLDDASGLQTSGTYGSAFIPNPLRQRDWYGNSDFDIRHLINVNAIYELPFGRGKRFGGGINRGLDALIGAWQLSGIFRWNTGLPISAPYDDERWATNWNVQSYTTPIRKVEPCVTKAPPKLFGCKTTAAYQSFRNAYPGESGSRNVFTLPGYVALDMGLSKSFTMPWNEGHKLQLRWEVFNVTNTQRFGPVDGSRTGYGIASDPLLNNVTPPANWSNFTGIQGAARVMQVGARYSF